MSKSKYYFKINVGQDKDNPTLETARREEDLDSLLEKLAAGEDTEKVLRENNVSVIEALAMWQHYFRLSEDKGDGVANTAEFKMLQKLHPFVYQLVLSLFQPLCKS